MTKRVTRIDSLRKFINNEGVGSIFTSNECFQAFLQDCDEANVPSKEQRNYYLTVLVGTGYIERLDIGTYKILQLMPTAISYYDLIAQYKTGAKLRAEKRKAAKEKAIREAAIETPMPPLDKSALDVQIGGTHYKDLKMQPIELIIALDLSFIQGSILKYISRYKHKGGIQDIEKCIHYAQLAREFELRKVKNCRRRNRHQNAVELADAYCKANNITGFANYVITYLIINDWGKVCYGCNNLIKQLTKANDTESLL